MEQFLTDPNLAPLPALGPCEVAACARRAESEAGYCPTHYVRWRTAVTALFPSMIRWKWSTATAAPGSAARAAAA